MKFNSTSMRYLCRIREFALALCRLPLKWLRKVTKNWRQAVAVFLILPLLLGALSVSAIFFRPLHFGTETFEIQPGATMNQVAEQLVERGVIQTKFFIKLLARWNKWGQRIYAGHYQLPAKMSLYGFMNHIVSGKAQTLTKVTILEGWTFAQMRATIAQAPNLKIVTADWSDAQIMEELGYPYLHPEGQFFPDTYSYHPGEEDLMLYRRAFAEMRRRLERAWVGRNRNIALTNQYQALILASILEKESGYPGEQPKIAGVFYNRMRLGMRLQTDPTVIYGLGPNFRGKLSRKHLRTDGPYNTYRRAGLPPTPISLPSEQSLRAAVHPATTSALYFVAKGSAKGHYFSSSLEEHNQAVARYRAYLKSQRQGKKENK